MVTYHNDGQMSGVNSSETTLSSANVKVGTFSKRFSTAVDGKVYAQPLYVPGVTVTGGSAAGTHNLVFVATQHDSVYAIDSDSGAVVWKTSLTASGLAGATSITSMPSGDSNSTDTSPEIGICSTPAIDPSTKMLYTAAKTKQIVASVPHYVYTLYKMDITKGSSNIVASTVICDTAYNTSNGAYTYHTAANATDAQDIFVPGTGDGAITVNGQSRVYFNGLRQMNRPGLLLSGGNVYIAFGSHGDSGPYHGWLIAYDTGSLTLKGVLNSTPNGGLGGFWNGGASPSIDANGYLYLMTGNGAFDGYNNNGSAAGLDSLGFPNKGNYGNSFLKVAVDTSTSVGNQAKNGWGLRVVDYFSPFNNASLNSADTDLGSGGVTILPDSAGSSSHPHLLVGAGKQGNLYLIDRDSLGKFSATTDNVVQSQTALGECFSTASFFNGVLYCATVVDHLKAFAISNARMSTSPVTSVDSFDWPGATLSISAYGTNNGIVWGVDNSSTQVRAYSASNVQTELWNSSQAANNTDSLGTPVKFAPLTVADGHVFVGTTTALVEYGLASTTTTPPAAPGNLSATTASALQINLSWTDNSTNENGFAIEQSTNGTSFTQIATVGVNVTNYAANSNLSSGTTYYYRVRAYNGGSNQTYSGYTNVANATTTAAGSSGSSSSINFSSGFGNSGSTLSYNGNSKIVNNRAELIDGGTNEASTVFTTTAQNIQTFSMSFTFQLTKANADGLCFIIQNNSAKALGLGGGDLGYGGLSRSVAIKFDIYSNAGEGTDSTGLFTNGADPYTPATDLSGSGITLKSGDVMKVTLNYDGTTLTEQITDTVTNASKTISYTVNIPSIVGASTAYVGFGGGSGGLSAVGDILTWTFTPPSTSRPADPTQLAATAVSGTQINLTWKDNSSKESGYVIMRATGSSTNYSQAGVTSANVTTFSDSGLIPNTSYSYQVYATNNAGNSGLSNMATATTPVPPPTPTNAKSTNVTTTSIAMSWSDNATNESGYNILRKTTTSSNFSQVATLPANSTTYTDTGLKSGTSYDYHIQAYNAAGYSDFSGFTATTH